MLHFFPQTLNCQTDSFLLDTTLLHKWRLFKIFWTLFKNNTLKVTNINEDTYLVVQQVSQHLKDFLTTDKQLVQPLHNACVST